MGAESFWFDQRLADAVQSDEFWDTDYEYYRVGDCQCPDPYLCQGRCINGDQGSGTGDSGSDALQ